MFKFVSLDVVLLFVFVVGSSGISIFQPYEFVNVTEHPGALCSRTCERNHKRICHFEFVLELYQAMGVACGKCVEGLVKDCDHPHCIVGDGEEKGVMSISRQIPGPAIQVCQGDTIIVDVINKAHGSASAIHWHGLHMRDTPFMDGVPYVTQCPTSYGSSFRYWFDAVEPGTHFYHSHSGHHKINGQYGALIVREPEEVVEHINEYDFDLPEHHILISDWMHEYGEQLFPGLPSTEAAPDSLLINGRGTFLNPTTFEHTNVPANIFFVQPGKKYRFRLINSMSHACPVQFQIKAHNVKVISSDSFNVEPDEFDTLVSNSGERYDFILTANNTEGDFWIRIRGMGPCQDLPLDSFALLRYQTGDVVSDNDRSQPPFPLFNDTYPLGRILNDPSSTCSGGTDSCCVTELVALEDDEELRTNEPDHQVFVSFNMINVPNSELFQEGSYPHFQNLFSSLTVVGSINNISIVFPSSPPLTQPNDVDESEYCNDAHLPLGCADKRYCSCVHRIKIELGSIVELVVVDEASAIGNIHHPFHLHGHRFIVTGLGQHPEQLPMTLERAKKIERGRGLERNYRFNKPPFKDTVSIPNRGYAVLRFRADNPGYWIMHCHYEWHFASGMGLLFQVGNQEDMVKPPSDFPKCNNYLPNLRISNNK